MAAKFNLRDALKREAPRVPDRMIVHGPEGVGKTTFAAFAPRPFFITVGGETGLQKLMTQHLVPDTAHIEVHSWEDANEALDQFNRDRETASEFSTVVVDSLSALELMAREFICRTKFNGDWSESGFAGFAKGLVQTAQEWTHKLLPRLDAIRLTHNLQVILIAHTHVKGFANPTGEDYDRFIPNLDARLWGPTSQWADMVLFLTFDEQIKKESKFDDAKASGGERRKLLTERRAAFDAKNRHGLPPQINLAGDHRKAWGQFSDALRVAQAKAAHNKPVGTDAPPPTEAPVMTQQELQQAESNSRGF